MPQVIRRSKIGPLYVRFDNFIKRYQSIFNVALGAAVIGISIYLVTVAVALGTQAEHEKQQHHRERVAHVKEAETVKLACIRSRAFAPPLIAFLEGAEAKLHTGALTVRVPLEGKKVAVLDFYRSTIPKSCPSK